MGNKWKWTQRKWMRGMRAWLIPLLCLLVEVIVWIFALGLREDVVEKMLERFSGCRFQMKTAGAVYIILKAFENYPRDICGTLITFGAITASVVVLFYTLIDAKNFGISHRTIMNYFFGSYTIPLLFMFLLCKLPILYMVACMGEMPVFLCIMSAYSVVQQLFIIGMIMLSTSCSFAIMIISGEVARLYKFKHRIGLTREEEEYFAARNTSYSVLAIQSDDIFSDRIKLLEHLLDVPLKYNKKNYVKLYKNNGNGNIWECAVMYNFYFSQLFGVFAALKDRREEMENFYQILYGFLDRMKNDKELLYLQDTPGYAAMYDDLPHVVSGAIMNAALICGLQNSESFCNHILNEIFPSDEERRKQMTFYFFILEFLWHIQGCKDSDLVILNQVEHVKSINGFDKWEIRQDDMKSLKRFWDLMVAGTIIEKEKMDDYYNIAINTYKGLGGNSAVFTVLKDQREEV